MSHDTLLEETWHYKVKKCHICHIQCFKFSFVASFLSHSVSILISEFKFSWTVVTPNDPEVLFFGQRRLNFVVKVKGLHVVELSRITSYCFKQEFFSFWWTQIYSMVAQNFHVHCTVYLIRLWLVYRGT